LIVEAPSEIIPNGAVRDLHPAPGSWAMALVLNIDIKNVFEEGKIVYAFKFPLETLRAKLLLDDAKHCRFPAAGPAYKKNIRHELT
jgi:hypothetical protein